MSHWDKGAESVGIGDSGEFIFPSPQRKRMSGGSYDYIYSRIDGIELRTANDPRRMAFQKLLKLVANAMYEIEWVDSGDNAQGDEYKAIDACFAFMSATPDVITKAQAYDALMENLKKFLDLKKE
jgi:hypothetical protein